MEAKIISLKSQEELEKLIKINENNEQYIDFEGYSVECHFDVNIPHVRVLNVDIFYANNLTVRSMREYNDLFIGVVNILEV